MGQLVNGQWQSDSVAKTDSDGNYVRVNAAYRNWLGVKDDAEFPVVANRYHLYVSYACPWCHRVLIMLALKGLQDVVSVSNVDPYLQDQGWSFSHDDPNYQDPLNDRGYLYEVYQQSDSQFTGKVTVPVLWDKKTSRMVNNESSDILRIFNSSFGDLSSEQVDYYPEAFQQPIDALNEWIYTDINNGVYRCGFANSQAAYDEAVERLFAAMDKVEVILSQQQFLVSDALTEADIRLFVTLIRFDAVYYGHFKCNWKAVRDYPELWAYLKRLYQIDAFKQSTRIDEIKYHYYHSHRMINPTGIVPRGPQWCSIGL